MVLALRRIKVYLKLAAILAAVGIVLLHVLMNQENTAKVWFFWTEETINVLWLILVTAVSAVILWWGIRKIFSVISELREVRRLAETQVQLDQQRKLADEMAEREKRIDEKVRRSISGQS